MSNDFYSPTGWPGTGVAGASAPGRAELALVGVGFDKMPPLTAHPSEFVTINPGATALTSVTAATVLSTIGAQPLDAELTAIAGLTSAADLGIQFTGVGTAATYALTTAGKALLDDASATVQRATLGSTATGDALFITASAATARATLGSTATGDALFITASAAAARTTLGSTATGDAVFIAANAAAARTAIGAVIGTNVQAWDADLDALAALTATAGMVSRTGAGAFAVRTLTGTAAEITVTNGDGSAAAPTFSLPTSLTFTGKTVTGGTFTGAAGAFTTLSASGATSVVDNNFTINGSADATKKVRLEVDGLTAGATRVVTVPDRDLTLGAVLAAEQASTSGTAIDFTGIPSGTKRITVMFKGMSTNGTSNKLIQIGKSGGPETSGYLGVSGSTNFTTGFGIEDPVAADILHGSIILSLENAATFSWVASGVLGLSNAGAAVLTAGSKSLSAELDRVRITTVNGTDAFDAGAISISYE